MKKIFDQDQVYMFHAIEQAKKAEAKGEVPVGAVVVYKDKIISTGFNQPILSDDPTAHAEIIAIREAAKFLSNYRLVGCTLYVTIEPCLMCFGALVHARIKRLVYGALEPKTGVCNSNLQLQNIMHHNHKFQITPGILEKNCKILLQEFFLKKRATN